MRLQLKVASGPQTGDECSLDPPVGYVGRGEDCALHLRDHTVSLVHLELRYQQDGWWAAQRSARSPSLLNGVAIGSQPVRLQHRGALQVGSIALEYEQEQSPASSMEDSPSTLINVRRQLPSIQSALLQHMEPLRASEPAPEETPATLILRRQPAAVSVPAPPPLPAAVDSEAAPPTFIRRPSQELGEMGIIPARVAPPVPPTLPPAHTKTEQPAAASAVHALRQECEELKRERQQLQLQLAQLREENAVLRKNAQPMPENTSPAGSAQALSLLEPFAKSLEQASAALQAGDPTAARMHLREASFGLADLRDLFEAPGP